MNPPTIGRTAKTESKTKQSKKKQNKRDELMINLAAMRCDAMRSADVSVACAPPISRSRSSSSRGSDLQEEMEINSNQSNQGISENGSGAHECTTVLHIHCSRSDPIR